MKITIDSLLDLKELKAGAIFDGLEYPWEALRKIHSFIMAYSETLPMDFERIEEWVWVGKGTSIDSNVTIKGPAVIGYDCEIRNSAYIRGNILTGNNVVIGNSSEVKNAILFNKVQVPHFNYVGDSILGFKAHLGAGVILSNLKSNGGTVKIKDGLESMETGLRKFGALIGDHAEIGCNSVLNPGSIIGRESIIYPLTSVRGIVPERHILKSNGELVARR